MNYMVLCRNGCGQDLTFDPENRSPSGKMIPINSATGENHQCPNRPPYVAGESGSSKRGGMDSIDLMGLGYAIEKVEEHISKIEKNLIQLVLEVQKVGMKLDGLPHQRTQTGPQVGQKTRRTSRA